MPALLREDSLDIQLIDQVMEMTAEFFRHAPVVFRTEKRLHGLLQQDAVAECLFEPLLQNTTGRCLNHNRKVQRKTFRIANMPLAGR